MKYLWFHKNYLIVYQNNFLSNMDYVFTLIPNYFKVTFNQVIGYHLLGFIEFYYHKV